MKNAIFVSFVLASSIGSLVFGGPLRPRGGLFSFKSKFSSYPQPQDFQRLLSSKFPFGFEPNCINNADPINLGGNNVASGDPVFQEPSLALVKWYSSCATSIAKEDYVIATVYGAGFDHYFSGELWKQLADYRASQNTFEGQNAPNEYMTYVHDDKAGVQIKYEVVTANAKIMHVLWQGIPEALKDAIILELVQHLIGYHVLEYETEFAAKIKEKIKQETKNDSFWNLSSVGIAVIKLIVMTPEFLTAAP